jgi:hypothetical protein
MRSSLALAAVVATGMMGGPALAVTVSNGFFGGFLDPGNRYRFFTHTDWDTPLFGVGIEPDTDVFGIAAPAHRVDGHVTFEADGLGNATVVESTGSFGAHPDFDLGSIQPITFSFFTDTFSGPGFPPVSDTRGDFNAQFLNILSGPVDAPPDGDGVPEPVTASLGVMSLAALSLTMLRRRR